MGSKFCVKFQRAPLKFHTKFWTHTLQNMHFTVLYFCVWVTISLNSDVISLSETGPRLHCIYLCVYLSRICKGSLHQDYFLDVLSITHLPPPCAVNWVSIDSNNGLSPVQHHAITWTNTGLLSIGPLESNFSEIWIKIHNFSFMKMHLNMSAKWRPFCSGGNELCQVTATHLKIGHLQISSTQLRPFHLSFSSSNQQTPRPWQVYHFISGYHKVTNICVV